MSDESGIPIKGPISTIGVLVEVEGELYVAHIPKGTEVTILDAVSKTPQNAVHIVPFSAFLEGNIALIEMPTEGTIH